MNPVFDLDVWEGCGVYLLYLPLEKEVQTKYNNFWSLEKESSLGDKDSSPYLNEYLIGPVSYTIKGTFSLPFSSFCTSVESDSFEVLSNTVTIGGPGSRRVEPKTLQNWGR